MSCSDQQSEEPTTDATESSDIVTTLEIGGTEESELSQGTATFQE